MPCAEHATGGSQRLLCTCFRIACLTLRGSASWLELAQCKPCFFEKKCCSSYYSMSCIPASAGCTDDSDNVSSVHTASLRGLLPLQLPATQVLKTQQRELQ